MSGTSNHLFLTHIQGLRGIAILLIILYHLRPDLCPNGYYGVDVFFVISGYFLFLNRFDSTSDFKFIDFCKKKILRILPPVFFCISLTLLISIAFLPAIDMVHAYVDAKHALIISTNFQINDGTNTYFSTNARSFSLMHLWYICVLLQSLLLFVCIFYIWAKFNISKKSRIISITILCLLSFAIHLQYILFTLDLAGAEYNVSTYCWTSARIWEIIAGGLLTLIPVKQSVRIHALNPPPASGQTVGSNVASYIGTSTIVLIILLSFIPFSQGTRFIPLIVILSIIPVIWGNSGIISKLLNILPLQTLGKYSYSLYLIHWPIVWIMEYIFDFPLSILLCLITVVIIIPLTVISYQLFEKNKKTGVCKFAFTLGTSCFLSFMIVKTLGFKDYFRVELNKISISNSHIDSSTPVINDSILMKNTERFIINLWGKASTHDSLLYLMGNKTLFPQFVLLGDSHAKHYKSAFDYLGKIHNWCGIYLNAYVHPFYGAEYSSTQSPDHTNTESQNQVLINWLKEQHSVKYIILANYWTIRYHSHRLWNGSLISEENATEARTQQLKQFCKRMNEIGKKVIILADTPSVKESDPLRYFRKRMFYGEIFPSKENRLQCSLLSFKRSTEKPFISFRQLENEGLCTVLTPHESLFKNGLFSSVDDNRIQILADKDHLTPDGAIKALSPLSKRISDLFNEK